MRKTESQKIALCGVLGVVYAVVYAVCGVRAAGEARRNEENGRE